LVGNKVVKNTLFNTEKQYAQQAHHQGKIKVNQYSLTYVLYYISKVIYEEQLKIFKHNVKQSKVVLKYKDKFHKKKDKSYDLHSSSTFSKLKEMTSEEAKNKHEILNSELSKTSTFNQNLAEEINKGK